MIEGIPDDILAMVRRAVARLDDALQSLRRARCYATIVSGVGKGTVDREAFLEGRRQSGVTATAILEDRGRLRKFVALARANSVDGDAVIRLLREEHKAWRRSNPSGVYYECRRVIREKEATRREAWAAVPFAKVGFGSREKRHGYDVRSKGLCTKAEIPDPLMFSAREYRWHASRAIKARRAAKTEAERREAEREAMREFLRARGKQTPEREQLAVEIHGKRRWKIGNPMTPEGIRKYYLDKKRRRLSPPEKTAERAAEQLKPYPWFAGAEVEDGTIVILASDMRAAKRDAGKTTSFEGKPIVLRKMPRKKTA